MSNKRPADFPTDAEIADARHVQQACGVIAAGVEAMMDEDDFYIWSRSTPGTQKTLGTVAVVGDTLNGNPYWRLRITKHFDSGDMVDYAYTFGDVTTAAQYAVNVAAQRGFALEVAA